MKSRILIAKTEEADIHEINECLEDTYEVTETIGLDQTYTTLLKQYRLIKVFMVEIALFQQNSYYLALRILDNVMLKHIPIICIGSRNTEKEIQTQLTHEVLKYGALSLFMPPFDFILIKEYIGNVIRLKDYANYANYKLLNNATKNFENEIKSGTFWNPRSLDSVIMNTTMGAACLLECIREDISIVRVNDDFESEILEGHKISETDLSHFFDKYMEEQDLVDFRSVLRQTIENRNKKTEFSCSFLFLWDKRHYHIQMNMRLIEKINDRALIYCVMENNTDKFEAINREADLMNQLQIIVQNFSGGITISYDGLDTVNYDYANDQFYSMLGYSREDFLNEEIESFAELIQPEYRLDVKMALNTAKNQMRPVLLVFQVRKRDGTVIWLKERCSFHFVKSRGKMAIISMYEDITNMKISEERIHQLNEKLANSEEFIQLDLTNKLVENYHSVYDAEQTSIFTQSRVYKEILLSKVFEEDQESIWNSLSFEALLNNYNSGNTKLSVEYRRYMPDGDILWFAATAVVLRGKGNDTINAFIFAHDIDEKMKIRIAKDRIMDTDVSDLSIINIASGMCRNIKIYDSDVTEQGSLSRYEDNLEKLINSEVVEEDRERCREFFRLQNLIMSVNQNTSTSISFWIKKKMVIMSAKVEQYLILTVLIRNSFL